MLLSLGKEWVWSYMGNVVLYLIGLLCSILGMGFLCFICVCIVLVLFFGFCCLGGCVERVGQFFIVGVVLRGCILGEKVWVVGSLGGLGISMVGVCVFGEEEMRSFGSFLGGFCSVGVCIVCWGWGLCVCLFVCSLICEEFGVGWGCV